MDNVFNENNILSNRYNNSVEFFYSQVLDLVMEMSGKAVESTRINEKSLQLNETFGWRICMLDNLKELSKHPGYFSKDSKDYSLYYLYLDVWHAINDYYSVNARYNKKDKNLTNALNKWKFMYMKRLVKSFIHSHTVKSK